jgi:hypothetical protein
MAGHGDVDVFSCSMDVEEEQQQQQPPQDALGKLVKVALEEEEDGHEFECEFCQKVSVCPEKNPLNKSIDGISVTASGTLWCHECVDACKNWIKRKGFL